MAATATVLRPCECRYAASNGFFEHMVETVGDCDCCGLAEELITLNRESPPQPGKAKPKEDKVRVCADCLIDWKGIEKRDGQVR